MNSTLRNLLAITLFLAITQVRSQSFAFTMSQPASQCWYGGNGTTMTVTSVPPGATSYSWSGVTTGSCTPGFTTYVSTGSVAYVSYPCPGLYTITCTAYNGSTLVATTSMTAAIQTTVSAAFIFNPNPICSAQAATVSLNIDPMASFTIQPGNQTSVPFTVSPVSTTNYTVFATGSGSCNTQSSGQLQVSTTPVITTSVVGNASALCPNVAIQITAAGALANSYTWSPSPYYTNGPLAYFNPVSGCYTVQGKNNAGCIGTAVRCVTVLPNQLVVTVPTVCPGSNATVSATGLTSYTWQWNPGPNYNFTTSTGSSFVMTTSTTPQHTFYVQGTTTAGCVEFYQGVVQFSTAPVLTVTANPGFMVCQGNSATLTVSGAQSYTWNPGGATGNTIVVNSPNYGSYQVVGSQTSGCNSFTTVQVSQQWNIPAWAYSSSVCAGNSTTLYTQPGWTYTWTGPGGLLGNTQTIAVTPSVSTCYSLAGTYTATGCQSTASVCITVTTLVSGINGPSGVCMGAGATLSVSNNMPGSYAYSWSPGTFTSSTAFVTPTTSTCYSVTVTSLNTGCSSTAVKCVSIHPAPQPTVTASSSCPGTVVTLTVTGLNTYTWYNGSGWVNTNTVTINTAFTPTYMLWGSDLNGCSFYTAAPVPLLPAPPITVTPVSQTVCPNSVASYSASGALSYTWNPGGVVSPGFTMTALTSTYVSVTASHSSGCNTYSLMYLTVGNNFSVMTAGGNTFCVGQTRTFYASGAHNYTFASPTSTVTGSYSLAVTPTASTCYTVTGQNTVTGCYSSSVICLTQGILNINTWGTPTIICAGSTSTLYASASGSVGYYWLPTNQSGSLIAVNPTVTTIYTVNASSNGCYGSATIQVNVNPAPSITVTGNQPICAGQPLTLQATGASSFVWSNSVWGSSVTIYPSANQTTFGVTGYSGCNGFSVINLTVYPNPVLSVLSSNSVCPGGQVTLMAFGASSYTWLPSNTNGTTYVASPNSTTTYTLIGQNSSGCKSTILKTIYTYPLPNVQVSGSGTMCAGTTATLTASGASTYTWSTNATGSQLVISPSSATCYTVTGTSANGCVNSGTHCVSVLTTTVAIAASVNTVCLGTGATFTASGANTYTWSTSANGSTIAVTPTVTTSYTVIGTGTNGCNGSAVITLTVDPNCSDVWPGDANSDGIVGTSDVLELGLQILSTGSARSPGGNSYVAQRCNNWTGTISTGKNKCHADCNGDGTVTAADTVAIFNNFGQPHAFMLMAGSGTELRFESEKPYFTAGEWNKANLVLSGSLGDISLYGLAAELGFTEAYIESGQVYLKYPSSFVDNGQNVIFRKTDFASGTIYAASVRTDHTDVSGSGTIAELHFKLKPGTEGEFMDLSAGGAVKVMSNGTQSSLSGGMTTVEIMGPGVGVKKNGELTGAMRLMPNPASDRFTIIAPQSASGHYEISDLAGRRLMQGDFTGSATVNTSELPDGIYLVNCLVNGTTHTEKLVIQK